MSISKPNTAQPETTIDPEKQPLLHLRYPDYTHPLFAEIAKKYMLEDGYDVEVYSERDKLSLWRAIQRLGYWCCYLQTEKSAWVVRLSKVKLTRKTNPLLKEYRRRYDTVYGKWQGYVTDISEGKTLQFAKRADAVRVNRLARERFETGYPPFKIEVTPNGKKFDVSMTWEKAPSSTLTDQP